VYNRNASFQTFFAWILDSSVGEATQTKDWYKDFDQCVKLATEKVEERLPKKEMDAEYNPKPMTEHTKYYGLFVKDKDEDLQQVIVFQFPLLKRAITANVFS